MLEMTAEHCHDFDCTTNRHKCRLTKKKYHERMQHLVISCFGGIKECPRSTIFHFAVTQNCLKVV
eukprot:TRINITY_DN8101_c0_g1_i1.p2 TRINITY_DN8101_c0_g1~~TRINITY_DN8101_c0_g1_i1.p2  ORF type:complete len:65 (+),score=1.45 TRINITY_DN8101_c0_g1_i1:1-195(+)